MCRADRVIQGIRPDAVDQGGEYVQDTVRACKLIMRPQFISGSYCQLIDAGKQLLQFRQEDLLLFVMDVGNSISQPNKPLQPSF